jgi:3-hydroxyacyl-CoA dehydrogenase
MDAEVAVIGAGTMGSMTLWNLARARDLWRELEAETGRDLLTVTGADDRRHRLRRNPQRDFLAWGIIYGHSPGGSGG